MTTTVLAAVLMTGSTAGAGVDFSMDWHTIDGGGGTSSGGDFTLSGTAGQADAGPVMTGNDFTFTGGFRLVESFQSPIPTVSEWGLVVMTLLVLTAGTLVFRRSRVGEVAE
jgi:hypothetical protein